MSYSLSNYSFVESLFVLTFHNHSNIHNWNDYVITSCIVGSIKELFSFIFECFWDETVKKQPFMKHKVASEGMMLISNQQLVRRLAWINYSFSKNLFLFFIVHKCTIYYHTKIERIHLVPYNKCYEYMSKSIQTIF